MVTRGHVAGAQRQTIEKLREQIETAKKELAHVQGAMSADDGRLEAAAQMADLILSLREKLIRVWGEHIWGCDTPDLAAAGAWAEDRAAVCEDRERLIRENERLKAKRDDYLVATYPQLANAIHRAEAAEAEVEILRAERDAALVHGPEDLIRALEEARAEVKRLTHELTAALAQWEEKP